MIHAFNGKSKFNLGEASELPDQTKTPFANIAQVQANKTWQFVAMATGTNRIGYIINNYKATELMIVCKQIVDSITQRVVTHIVSEELLPISTVVDLYVGNNTFNGIVEIQDNRYRRFIEIKEFFYSNVNISSNMTIELYVKE